MFQRLQSTFLALNPDLSPVEWSFIESIIEVKDYPRRSFFIEAGSQQNALGFVDTGLLRGFYADGAGEEITVRFVPENRYATHYSALLKQEPSRYSFQCLEPSRLFLLPFDRVLEGYAQFKGLEKFGRLIAERILIQQQSRIEDFQFLNAEARYRKFLSEYPDLFNRVSLSHLSTYLGIKRPSLSRIRRKILEG